MAPSACLFRARPPHFTRPIVVLFPHSSKSGEDIAEVDACKILGPVVEGDLTFGVHREGITSTSSRHSSRNLPDSHLALIIFTMISTFVPLGSPFLTKKTLMLRSFSRQCAPCRYNIFHQASTPLTYWSLYLFGATLTKMSLFAIYFNLASLLLQKHLLGLASSSATSVAWSAQPLLLFASRALLQWLPSSSAAAAASCLAQPGRSSLLLLERIGLPVRPISQAAQAKAFLLAKMALFLAFRGRF